ncbi:MAG: hypothetical protein QOI34_906 [Verrucomicrobiota bacterium]
MLVIQAHLDQTEDMNSSRTVRLIVFFLLGAASYLSWSCANTPPVSQGNGQICIYIPPYFEFKHEGILTAFLKALDKFSPNGELYYIKVHTKSGDKTYGHLSKFCCTPVKTATPMHFYSSVQVTQHVNTSMSRDGKANDELQKVLGFLQ